MTNIAKSMTNNIQSWGVLAIVIVILSIVLVKFKNVTGSTSGINTTIDTFVSAIAEPKNWVSIVIIAMIGFAVLKIFKGKKN